MREVFIPGPSGKIQGKYCDQGQPRVVLILPPHPKHGGTMNNRTVHAMHVAFSKNNFSTLRINFRGVQKSEGDFSNSFDDAFLRDASAAIHWLQEQAPLIAEFWVAGFSFGAWMAMNLVMRRPETTGFIAISPPVERYDFSFIFPCTIPGLIVQGSADKMNNPLEVDKLASRLINKTEDVKYKVIEGADYKYSNDSHLEELSQVVQLYLESLLDNVAQERKILDSAFFASRAMDKVEDDDEDEDDDALMVDDDIESTDKILEDESL